MHGGSLVADVLAARGVRFLFTLCGGHISPILVACKRRGLRVVDVRHEVNAVFAADATARLSGVPGVTAVTAGPGATNTITAVKNSQLAQSPVVLLGGATATILRGRGALQDIDQMALMRPHVKWAARARRRREIAPLLERAFDLSKSGVPGPVFLELPVDLLYPEEAVRPIYGMTAGSDGVGLAAWLRRRYLERQLRRLFAAGEKRQATSSTETVTPAVPAARLSAAASLLRESRRPLLVAGSQVVVSPRELGVVVGSIEQLGVPVYLSGMARGLLGHGHPLHLRHRRKEALREADLVILAGVPCDFRLGYGRHIPSRTAVVAVNRSASDLRKNRRPRLGVRGDPARFLQALAQGSSGTGGAVSSEVEAERAEWLETRRRRDQERQREIEAMAGSNAPPVNPLHLCQMIDQALNDDSIVVADGGDFVATASYIVRPRRPLSWLDPGPFGTLGVGAGFALGAKLCRPDAEVWILYGDGSAAYSLMEFDTFVRHGIPVIAVVGNDACWTQIARDQVAILEDDVGTTLARSDYHRVAEGWGARGLLLGDQQRAGDVLDEAKKTAAAGTPVLINAHIGATEFRKGSLSV